MLPDGKNNEFQTAPIFASYRERNHRIESYRCNERGGNQGVDVRVMQWAFVIYSQTTDKRICFACNPQSACLLVFKDSKSQGQTSNLEKKREERT